MGDGDAVADAGGSHRLPGLEHRQQEVAVHLGGQGELSNDVRQNLPLAALSTDGSVHAAALQQPGERRGVLGFAPCVLQQAA